MNTAYPILPSAPYVTYGGVGYGYLVAVIDRLWDGTVGPRVISGPYTTRDQADATAARIALEAQS